MQSQSRRFKRINSGLQNVAQHSTKIAKPSPAEKIGLSGYRKGRFRLSPLGGLKKFIRNLSTKYWIGKYMAKPIEQ